MLLVFATATRGHGYRGYTAHEDPSVPLHGKTPHSQKKYNSRTRSVRTPLRQASVSKKPIIRERNGVVYSFGRYIERKGRFPLAHPLVPTIRNALCVEIIVARTPVPNTPQTPFADSNGDRSRGVGLWILFVSMVVFAAISLLLMLAARVPAIANSLNDLLGVSRIASPDRPDRSTHLFMLLFCYASPLLLMLWVSLLRSLAMRNRWARPIGEAAPTESDPFA